MILWEIRFVRELFYKALSVFNKYFSHVNYVIRIQGYRDVLRLEIADVLCDGFVSGVGCRSRLCGCIIIHLVPY